MSIGSQWSVLFSLTFCCELPPKRQRRNYALKETIKEERRGNWLHSPTPFVLCRRCKYTSIGALYNASCSFLFQECFPLVATYRYWTAGKLYAGGDPFFVYVYEYWSLSVPSFFPFPFVLPQLSFISKGQWIHNVVKNTGMKERGGMLTSFFSFFSVTLFCMYF